MKQSTAYDPIRDEDVTISNCRDLPHAFDVEMTASRENGQDPRFRDETAKEHPMLVRSDLSHDAVEGCQGTVTRIVEEDCPFCGYDRADHTHVTLAGVHQLTCRRCGADIDDESRPQTDQQRLDKEHEWGERLGSVGRFDRDLWTNQNTETYWVDDGSNRYSKFRGDELLDAALDVAEQEYGSLANWIDSTVEDKQLRPAVDYNPNAIHVGRFAVRNDSWAVTGLMVDVARDLDGQVIHFPPEMDGIAI